MASPLSEDADVDAGRVRLSSGKAAGALAVAGVLMVGLAACGGGSSSQTTTSTKSVLKKQALGIVVKRPFAVTVKNRTGLDMQVRICDGPLTNDTSCTQVVLSRGEETKGGGFNVNGSMDFVGCKSVFFNATEDDYNRYKEVRMWEKGDAANVKVLALPNDRTVIGRHLFEVADVSGGNFWAADLIVGPQPQGC